MSERPDRPSTAERADSGTLERLFDRTLRDLPPRRAPVTLESRVLGEIGRRAAQPWWQRSFLDWPRTARAGFVSICGGLIMLTVLAGPWALTGLRWLAGLSPLAVVWPHQAVVMTDVAAELAAVLTRAVPSAWLYGGLTIGAALYVVLFGLGAAAYRTLYLNSGIAGKASS